MECIDMKQETREALIEVLLIGGVFIGTFYGMIYGLIWLIVRWL